LVETHLLNIRFNVMWGRYLQKWWDCGFINIISPLVRPIPSFAEVREGVPVFLHVFPILAECDKHKHDEVAKEERPIDGQVEELEEGCESGDHGGHCDLLPEGYLIHRPQQGPVV
jgi:hypothetical protein